MHLQEITEGITVIQKLPGVRLAFDNFTLDVVKISQDDLNHF